MRPVVLCILDGWGLSPSREANAVALGATRRTSTGSGRACPHAHARGARAGRRAARGADGQLRGRAHQHRRRAGGLDGPAADRQRASPTAASRRTPRSRRFVAALKASGGTAHVAGLASPGGVHAHQRHIAAAAAAIAAAGVPVAVHAFLDGRDVPPSSARRADRRARGGAAGGARASPRSPGGSTRWTATSAGSGWRRRRRRCCAARGRGRRAPRRRSRPPTRAARPTSS